MKTFLAILILTTTVFGGKSHPESENLAFKKAIERQIRSLNIPVPSENARVFSQEDQLFPARYFYPTYPEYVDSRFTAYNTKLAPASADQPISSLSSAWTRLIPITSFALLYGAKAGIYLFSVLLILIVGVVFTTTICTFTPLCTISFPAFELTKNQVKEQVAELARNYITPESLDAATALVQKAVDKYASLQMTEHEENETSPPPTTIEPSSSTQPPS